MQALLNWGWAAFSGSPCGKNALENLRALQHLPGALLMNPSPCHIFHNETTEVHGEAFLLLQRQQKCSHADVSVLCFHSGAQSSFVPAVFWLTDPPWAEA